MTDYMALNDNDLNPTPPEQPVEYSKLTLAMSIAANIQGTMVKVSEIVNGELGHIPLDKGLFGIEASIVTLREAEALLTLYAGYYKVDTPPRDMEHLRQLLMKWNDQIKAYESKNALAPIKPIVNDAEL